MTPNARAANAFIRQLQKRREKQQDFGRTEFVRIVRKSGRDRKPPGNFVDSSFLFIRSANGDSGVRPLAGNVPFWLSPDLRISPLTGLGAYTQTLEAGKTYSIACVVRNRGDVAAPSAKVEFFLADPTIGMDTRFAKRLGVGSTWIAPRGSGEVRTLYTVPANEAGHKCLFGRVFSFSPLDLPIDDFQLDPRVDRHIGQLNLNIVPQSTALTFQWIHQPNANDTIELRSAPLADLLALGHPALGDFKLSEGRELTARLRRALFKLIEDDGGKVSLERTRTGIQLISKGKGPSAVEQRKVSNRLDKALQAIQKGAKPSEFSEIFIASRKLNRAAARHLLQLELPSFGLRKGQATAIHLQGLDGNTGQPKGGITLLITG